MDRLHGYGIGFAVDGSDIGEIRRLINYIYCNKEVLLKKESNLAKIQYKFSWEEIVKNLDKYILHR